MTKEQLIAAVERAAQAAGRSAQRDSIGVGGGTNMAITGKIIERAFLEFTSEFIRQMNEIE